MIFFFRLLLLFLFTAHGIALADDHATSVANIGVLMPLTGEYAMQASAFHEGLELALDEINARSGQVQLRIIVEDTHDESSKALSAARKLMSVDKVIAAMTTSFPELKVGGAEFQKSKIPVIHLWDSSPEIDSMGDYIFGIGPWAPSSGEVSADFAFDKLHARTAIVLSTEDEWSELVGDYFVKRFTLLGGKVLDKIRINPDTSDFRAYILRIKSRNPQVVYAPLTNNVVAFHKQKKQLSITSQIISSDVIADEHINKSPAAFEGVYQTSVVDPSNEHAKKVFSRYEAKYNKKVTMPWFVGTGYDGLMLLGDAIQFGGTKPEDIMQMLYGTKDRNGTTGKLSMTPAGSIPQIAAMYQIKDAKFAFVWKTGP